MEFPAVVVEKSAANGIVGVTCLKMRIARWFIYGLPAALILLLGVSFWNASRLSADKKNEMSLGLLGEPSTLNPIQQADSASSQVSGSIFNGLLKYNPDLEIIGDLAKSWTLHQTTTFVFRDAQAAEAAAELAALEIADSDLADALAGLTRHAIERTA